uniref:Reverse transcriptase-beet retrotransposon, putative n=1 Tax=Medicago truncatula TaxID=3880 RepID=A2Q4C3_MEDTR|nr:reverse transcriptase - beet retrotransposon, putative [Medicago truncatula]
MFTLFKEDGKSMSRLDWFLLSEEWCLLWSNCLQIAQLRGLSDHCPLILSVDEENWAPTNEVVEVLERYSRFRSLSGTEGVSLIKPFLVDEVKAAVWDCDSFKSPGLDGINFGFIKDLWLDMKDEIMRFVSKFHCNGKLSKGINTTFIALIPKVDSLQKLNDFRPFSLVGRLYKILAKLLANRLRGVIGSVISDSQSAFVKNRKILDGILIANEVVDEARKKNKDLMLFKADFEKAYDSIDLGYLDSVLAQMSFPVLWRKWIRECVSTATTSVLVNGSPTDEFPLQRGLRQGDPWFLV